MTTTTECRYETLAEMQGAHERLMQLLETDSGHSEAGLTDGTAEREPLIRILDPLLDFLRAGARCGAYLCEPRERRTAQAILDYWASKFYGARLDVPRPLLEAHDAALLPNLPDSACPYVGLDAFDEEHAKLFCGREERVDALIERLRTQRLVIVTGTSGSGKSSLVLAGLLPALRAGGIEGSADWRYLPPLVPGDAPLEHLVRSVAKLLRPGSGQDSQDDKGTWRVTRAQELLDKPDGLVPLLGADSARPCVVAVDQFEEAMTLRTGENANAFSAFVSALQALVDAPAPAHRVVLTMRSDVDVQLAREYPELNRRYESAAFPLSSMDSLQLRRAIELPAARVGLKFQEGVIDELIESVVGEDAGLPLLQFNLMALWDRRQGNLVTMEAHRKIGSPRMAMAQAAEQVYAELPADQRLAAEQIFLELSRSGEGAAVFRNRATRGQLHRVAEPEVANRVIEKFARARLVRVTQIDPSQPLSDKIEVAHEALLRNWGLLQRLFAERRNERDRRAFLRRQAQKWREAEFDSAFLLGGLALQQANVEFGQGVLSALERDFLAASLEAERQAHERAAADAEARVQFERDRADLAIRKIHLRNWAVGAMAISLLVLAVAMLESNRQLARAKAHAIVLQVRARDDAVVLQERADADARARLSKAKEEATELFRRAEIEARNTKNTLNNVIEKARQDSLQAHAEDAEARRAIQNLRERELVARAEALANRDGASDPAAFVFLAGEAARLDPAILPRLTSGLIDAVLLVRPDQLIPAERAGTTSALTLDGTGRRLLQASGQGLIVWALDAEGGPQPVRRIPQPAEARPVRFLDYAPDGRTFAAAAGDAVWLWAPGSENPHRLGTLPGAKRLHFSANGESLIAIGSRKLMAWSVADSRETLSYEWPVNARIADATVSKEGDRVFLVEFPDRQKGQTRVREFKRAGSGFESASVEFETPSCGGPRTTIAAGVARIGLSMSPRVCLIDLLHATATGRDLPRQGVGIDVPFYRGTIDLDDIVIGGADGGYLVKLTRQVDEAQLVDVRRGMTVRLQGAFDLPKRESYEQVLSLSDDGSRLAIMGLDESIRLFSIDWADRLRGDRSIVWLSSNDEVLVVSVPTNSGPALDAVDRESGARLRGLSEGSRYSDLDEFYLGPDARWLHAIARCAESANERRRCVVSQDLRSPEAREHPFKERVNRAEDLYVLEEDNGRRYVYSASAGVRVFSETPPEAGPGGQPRKPRFILGNGRTFAVWQASGDTTSVDVYTVEGAQARRLSRLEGAGTVNDVRFLGNGRVLQLASPTQSEFVDLHTDATKAAMVVPGRTEAIVGEVTGMIAWRQQGQDWSLGKLGEQAPRAKRLPASYRIERNGVYAHSSTGKAWQVRRLAEPADIWLEGSAAGTPAVMQFSQDGETLTVRVLDTLSVFDLKTKTRRPRIEVDTSKFGIPSLTPSGRYLRLEDGRLIPADARALLGLAQKLHKADENQLRCRLLEQDCAKVRAATTSSAASPLTGR